MRRMKKALDLYSIRTELENGSISEFTDLSWKNPLVVEARKYCIYRTIKTILI